MKSKYILLTILLTGLAVRIPFLFQTWNASLQIIDEQHYNSMAQYFAQSGNFGMEVKKNVYLSSIRPPMYIWTVAGFYKVLGTDNPAVVQLSVRIFQVLIALLTVWLIYRIGLKAFKNETTALIGAGLFCFYPSMVMQNFMILTETEFTLFLVLTLYFAVNLFPDESEGTAENEGTDENRESRPLIFKTALFNAALCGLFLGLGALTRSILWLAIPCVFLYFLLFVKARWTIRLSSAAAALIVSSAVIAPWVVRNTQLQKTLTAIDCMSGRNLMMGNYEYTPMYRAWDAIHQEGEKNWYNVLRSRYENVDPMTQGQKDKLAGKYAKEFMMSHLGLTLQRFGMKALCFWQLERSTAALVAHGDVQGIDSENSKRLSILVAGIVMLYYALVFTTAVFGVFFASPKQWRVHLLFLCVVGLFWGVHSLVFAHSRYHLPLTPLLCLYSASYVTYVIKNGFDFTRRQIPSLIFSILIVGTFVGFWTLETLWYLG
ncbi:MAG: glycosyltransferase family 39 protein [Thermoguttaceae bacterium]|nr:glycosyltransferase family 39 protein [Thermoguttaceae bacterium]